MAKSLSKNPTPKSYVRSRCHGAWMFITEIPFVFFPCNLVLSPATCSRSNSGQIWRVLDDPQTAWGIYSKSLIRYVRRHGSNTIRNLISYIHRIGHISPISLILAFETFLKTHYATNRHQSLAKLLSYYCTKLHTCKNSKLSSTKLLQAKVNMYIYIYYISIWYV